jgi:crotonobetaine/carnitine-CoA ligase
VTTSDPATDDLGVHWPPNLAPAWSACPLEPITHVLGRAMRSNPDHVPLVFEDGFEITSGQLLAEVEALAGALSGRVGVGDRVILAIGNRAEFVIAFLAVIANRGVAVCLSPELGQHEAAFVVDDSSCRIAMVDETSRAVFDDLAASSDVLKAVLPVIGEEPRGFRHLSADAGTLDLLTVDASMHDVIDIGYTSGTTGLPKALGGTHRGLLRYIDVHLRTHADPSQRLMFPLQLHYGDPLSGLFAAIVGGTSIVLVRKFSVSRFWEVARRTGATSIFTIGSIPDMLLNSVPSPDDRAHKVREAVAIAVPRARHAELEERFGFPWREVYGSSETGPAIAMPAEHGHRFVGTGALGIPYPDVEARLVDERGEVIPGEGVGELQVRGEIVFSGYVGHPEATAEVMDGDWLRSGDLLRRDRQGVYYFEGRSKELIRRSGINIAPAEIESVLRLHPSVEDVAVVPVPDPVMGEEIKAYVKLVDGGAWNPAGLLTFAAERLSRQKLPRYLEQRAEPFPRTETQRIPKAKLMVDGAHRVALCFDSRSSGAEEDRRGEAS